MLIEEKVKPQLEHSNEQPPSYNDTVTTSSSASASTASSGEPAPSPPTNFLHISRTHNGIKGSWVIDTGISIPSSMLGPLAEGEERRPNVKLETIDGRISARIRLKGNPNSQRAVIITKSEQEKVSLKVHRDTPGLAISLSVTSSMNYIILTIPKDFRGPLRWRSKHGVPPVCSSGVQARLINFGEKRASTVTTPSSTTLTGVSTSSPSSSITHDHSHPEELGADTDSIGSRPSLEKPDKSGFGQGSRRELVKGRIREFGRGTSREGRQGLEARRKCKREVELVEQQGLMWIGDPNGLRGELEIESEWSGDELFLESGKSAVWLQFDDEKPGIVDKFKALMTVMRQF